MFGSTRRHPLGRARLNNKAAFLTSHAVMLDGVWDVTSALTPLLNSDIGRSPRLLNAVMCIWRCFRGHLQIE